MWKKEINMSSYDVNEEIKMSSYHVKERNSDVKLQCERRY